MGSLQQKETKLQKNLNFLLYANYVLNAKISTDLTLFKFLIILEFHSFLLQRPHIFIKNKLIINYINLELNFNVHLKKKCTYRKYIYKELIILILINLIFFLKLKYSIRFILLSYKSLYKLL